MGFSIFRTEFLRNFRGLGFYVFFAAMAAISIFTAMDTDPGSFMMGINIIHEDHNAPILIAKMTAVMSVIGVLFIMILAGRAVVRDFEVNVHEFLFTAPIGKSGFLFGRFFGALAAAGLIFSGVFIGWALGCSMLKPDLTGPFRISAYWMPVLFILLPNLLFIGSIFFSIATLTRRAMNSYLAGVALLALYGAMQGGFTGWENDNARMLLDPFCVSALNILTRYWTTADINQLHMPLAWPLLVNRILWTSAAAGILMYTLKRFRFVAVLESRKSPAKSLEAPSIPPSLSGVRSVLLDTGWRLRLGQGVAMIGREFKRIVFHPAFLILTFMAISEALVNFVGNVGLGDSRVLPITSWFLKQTPHLWIYVIPLTILFGGHLVWRERSHRTHEYFDALPVPHELVFVSKLATLMAVQTLYVLLAMISGIAAQRIIGGAPIEIGLYFKHLFGILLPKFWFIAVLVLFIQSLSPNQIAGFCLSAMAVLADLLLFEVVRLDQPLLRYGNIPGFIYSNINGFGPYGAVIFWYSLYWTFGAAVLVLLTAVMWRRSLNEKFGIRWRRSWKEISNQARGGLTVCSLLFILTGGFIALNRYILNPYTSRTQAKRIGAVYEKKYSGYEEAAQPNKTSVSVRVDLYPEARKARIQGEYGLKNRTDSDITEILVQLSTQFIDDVSVLEFDRPAEISNPGCITGMRIYKLAAPLHPGDSTVLRFCYQAVANGFSDNHPMNELDRNCTYFLQTAENPHYFPIIGYNPIEELTNRRDRQRFGLAAREAEPPPEKANRKHNFFRMNRVHFDAVVSTTAPHIALSSGNQIGSWTEGGRNYSHYRSDKPMEDELVFASGNYSVMRDTCGDVAIEVYYFPQHPYNIRDMIDGAKVGLEYCESAFSQFPYRHLRIVELPNYLRGGARSQPTVFIWQEDAGFIMDTQKSKFNLPFSVCAHELAHQWWGYIVSPAFSQGVGMLTENMAMYVQTMCMEKAFGKEMVQRFLEKQRRDYLSQRSRDTEGEQPLMRSKSRQYHLEYYKGAVAMHTLREYWGEDRLNSALSTMVKRYGNREQDFPTSLDMVKIMKDQAPEGLLHMVEDWFETITLWENKVVSAEAFPLDNGRYKVCIGLDCHKFRADSLGVQTEIPMNDTVEISILGEKGKELLNRMHRIPDGGLLEFIVAEKPEKVGVDSRILLLDRKPEDNVLGVTIRAGNGG